MAVSLEGEGRLVSSSFHVKPVLSQSVGVKATCASSKGKPLSWAFDVRERKLGKSDVCVSQKRENRKRKVTRAELFFRRALRE